MKGNQKRIISLTIILHIFIISFAIMAIPATADDLGLPEQALYLQGNVMLDGAYAPVDTVVSVELDGQPAGSIVVENNGDYDNFPVTCSSEDYSNLKFYVNEIAAQLVDATVFDNANSGDVIGSVDFVATTPVGDTNDDGDSSGSSGSSGSSYTKTTTSGSDEIISDPSTSVSFTDADDTSLKSVATTQPTESTGEEIPASETETGLSMMEILIGAIVMIGIVVTVGYRLKKN